LLHFVYPNPANNYLIVYNYKTEKRRILLYDMSGKAVRNMQTNELATRVNTQDLKTGLYILSVKGPDGKNIRTEKIVIVR